MEEHIAGRVVRLKNGVAFPKETFQNVETRMVSSD